MQRWSTMYFIIRSLKTANFLTFELEYNRWDFKDLATPKLKDCQKNIKAVSLRRTVGTRVLYHNKAMVGTRVLLCHNKAMVGTRVLCHNKAMVGTHVLCHNKAMVGTHVLCHNKAMVGTRVLFCHNKSTRNTRGFCLIARIFFL